MIFNIALTLSVFMLLMMGMNEPVKSSNPHWHRNYSLVGGVLTIVTILVWVIWALFAIWGVEI